MQKAVVRRNWATALNVKDIKIYAKTSTAQTSGMDKHDLGGEYLEHGWFVAYFSYNDQKPLTLVILTEHSGTSRTSTPIAADLFADIKN